MGKARILALLRVTQRSLLNFTEKTRAIELKKKRLSEKPRLTDVTYTSANTLNTEELLPARIQEYAIY